MHVMRELQREKTYDLRTSLFGLASVVVCIIAFLFILEVVVIAVRFIVG